MAPENEGKPAAMSSRMVEVRHEVLEEIESLLVKTQVQMDDTWASDLLSRSHLATTVAEETNEADDPNLEALRVLTTKQDNMKLTVEVCLLKLRSLMLPRQRGLEEEMCSNMTVKRGRPISPLQVPRLPDIPGLAKDTKLGRYDSSSLGMMGSPSPVRGDMLPLKFIRTGDNTKAPFQKPSTIFMPTAKIGVPMDASGDLVSRGGLAAPAGVIKPTATASTSPRRRPSRSRRDRNRTRSRVVAMPEPVLQTLQPGDPNKIPEDGYLWRKYGNKPIKTASYKRGYFKCRNFKEVKCMATKIVQQTEDDPSTFSVCYKGEHTCRQQGKAGLITRPPMAGPNSSTEDRANETDGLSDPTALCSGKDGECDEALEGMDWPSGENSCDSASDEMFASVDVGEETVESDLTTAVDPNSNLIVFDDMPSITTLPLDSLGSTEIAEANVANWVNQSIDCNDFKTVKCPPGEQGGSQADLMNVDDDDQLLKIINSNMWVDHQPSDINYWYHDMAPMESNYLYSTDLLNPLR